jgi:electron transfer flavoprotein beta subunit
LNVLVCVKRVPETGARITLTPDEQAIDTSLLGFTISPHEECAVEEALRIATQYGGSTTVLTLGPHGATEQLQNAMAMGIDTAVLLETDGGDWNAEATATALAEAIRTRPEAFDLLLFGNEAADTGDYQVGVRVAHALGLPCVPRRRRSSGPRCDRRRVRSRRSGSSSRQSRRRTSSSSAREPT